MDVEGFNVIEHIKPIIGRFQVASLWKEHNYNFAPDSKFKGELQNIPFKFMLIMYYGSIIFIFWSLKVFGFTTHNKDKI